MARAALIALVLFLLGSGSGCAGALQGPTRILAAANDALDVLCDSRDTLGLLRLAADQLSEGDACAAREALASHLVNVGHDREVAAVLGLIETQARCGAPILE